MKLTDMEHTDARFTDVQGEAPRSLRDDSERVDILDLLTVIAERKAVIVRATVACLVLAVVTFLLLPKRYTAVTVILPPQETKSTAALMLNQLAGSGLGSLASLAGGGLGIKNQNDIYIGILKSRTIQDSLIQQFDLLHIYRDKKMSDARMDLARHSDVVSDKEGMIRISVEDSDPRRAAGIANAYVDELRKLTQELAVTEASRRRIFFEQEVQQAKDALSTAEVHLKETQQKTGMIQLDSQAKAVIDAIGTVRGQIAAKEVQLQAMHSYATDQNPNVVLVQEQLVGLRAQLKKFEQQQGPDAGDPLLATAKVPSIALEYVRSLREVKYREAVFEALAKEFEAAKLDEAKDAAVIQVLDKAVEPDKKSFPKMSIMVALGVCFGLFGSVLYCLVRSRWDTLLADPEFASRAEALKSHLLGRRGRNPQKHKA